MGRRGARFAAAEGGRMRRSSFAVFIALGLALGGCKTFDDNPITGSISTPAAPPAATSPEGWRAIAAQWQPAYDKNPSDPRAAMIYARALRETDQNAQALAVVQRAAIANPKNQALLGEYGRALAANGQFDQALDVLSRAHTPDKPDWRILMAQGAVLDQMGRSGEARDHYDTALKIAPGEPSVLSNLGLSYALSNDLANAEKVLRQANADPRADMRARQNLALVLALQGKFGEAQTVASRDLSPAEAAQNIASIREMVSQTNNWQKLKTARKLPPQG